MKESRNTTIADIEGEWQDPQFESSLIVRCREAWDKPISDLNRSELATFLRQKIAIAEILPVAIETLQSGLDDDSEVDDDELFGAIEYAKKFA